MILCALSSYFAVRTLPVGITDLIVTLDEKVVSEHSADSAYPVCRQSRVAELQSREEEALEKVSESVRVADQAQLERAEAQNTADTLRRYGFGRNGHSGDASTLLSPYLYW